MGFFRFLLALAVVLFHSGLGGGAGPFAVFMFYILSGFVITRVLDVKYTHYRFFVLKFYINRAVKLFPIFIVATALASLISIFLSSSLVFSPLLPELPFIVTKEASFFQVFLKGLFPDLIVRTSPVFSFFTGFSLISVYWTVGIELLFYLIVPNLFFFPRYKIIYIYLFLFGISLAYYSYSCTATYTDYQEFLFFNYRNALTSLFFFWWGGVLYLIKKMFRLAIPYQFSLLFGGFFLVSILLSGVINLYSQPAINFIIWQCGILFISVPILLSARVPKSWQRFNEFLGGLSYPMYVIHKLVVASVLLGFKAMGVALSLWLTWSLVVPAVILLSILIDRYIDKPILRVRDIFSLGDKLESNVLTKAVS